MQQQQPVSQPINPATGQPFELYPDHSVRGMFSAGLDTPDTRLSDSRIQSLIKDSAFNVFDPRYRQVFSNPNIPPQGKAAYVAGRLTHDLITDGTRRPWWALNHPMAQVGLVGELGADAANLTPDYDVYHQRLEAIGETPSRRNIDAAFAQDMGFSFRGQGRGVPLGLARAVPGVVAAGTMMAASGNSDFLNVTGGGRIPGFAAVLPTEQDPRQSENPALELAARYVFGRTGRMLPWEQFTLERPDVSPTDYNRYSQHQRERGPFLGILKGTTRNINAEPEYEMLGFRVPLSAAAATVGSAVGAAAGARVADAPAHREQISKLNPALRQPGNRRLAGAALGSLVGIVAGNVGARAANELAIQPVFHPEEHAIAQAWQQRQQQRGAL